MPSSITPRATNFPQWYQDVISAAPDLYDESPVTGCITFGPLATKLWGKIREEMDTRLRKLGVENIMLPLLIPQSFFEREKEHVEGFAPECAVVTEAGGSKLPEAYAIRPTSETLFVDWYTRNGRVQSHRDLPLLVNQWCSVMRWEKRPRAFLRTTEFHWQEGHCLFATEEQCRRFTLQILDLYADLSEHVLSIPVIKGYKPRHEVFPGAIDTYTIEGMMQDGKALQMGTSHMLSQNFLKGSDGKPLVSFLDADGKEQIPFYNSWAVTTRLIGAMIMTHGDDDGIVLPPKIAPCQCTILPIFGSDEGENGRVREAARALALSLATGKTSMDGTDLYAVHGREAWFQEISGELTVRIDERDARLGDKTFYQIKSGTPVRIELGSKDLAKGSCVIKSRIRPRDAAVTCALSEAPNVVRTMLHEDQATLFARALQYRDAKIVHASTASDVVTALDAGSWALIPWDGSPETVADLKTKTTGGTYRCFGFNTPKDAKDQIDPLSQKPSAFEQKIYVAKAY